jgi:hypothetical protein
MGNGHRNWATGVHDVYVHESDYAETVRVDQRFNRSK